MIKYKFECPYCKKKTRLEIIPADPRFPIGPYVDPMGIKRLNVNIIYINLPLHIEWEKPKGKKKS